METMTFETVAASDGLYLAFPHGFLDSSDVWLGSGWIDKIVISPGSTAPTAAAVVKVYEAFDYSTNRAYVNATTLARYSARPGGTLAGTRGNSNPVARVATMSLTNLRPLAQANIQDTSADVLAPITVTVDRHMVSGMIVAITTDAAEAGTFFVTVHYVPETSGATRKRWAAKNQPAAGV